MSKVVVLGSNFGGLVAALSIRHELKDEVDVTVISPSDRFVFNPSLIWLPFGKRDVEDLSFRVAPTFEEHGVNFVNTAASAINADANSVTAGGSEYSYDYLVVATGYKNHYGVVEGLGPNGNASTITSLEDAVHAGEAWSKYLADPGDVVIGATQGASCFGAAYEFLFNASYHLNKNHLKEKVKLTYVTSEPFLGHFGIGGLPHGQQLLEAFLKHENINYVVDASIDHIDSDSVKLASGENLPFKYSMFIPPFLGQDVVVESGLADPKGYIPVRPTYQSLSHDNLYAVGIAAQVTAPWQSPTPVGIPKTGYPTEVMAHVAAKNIISQIKGESPTEEHEFKDIKAVCVMDAGNNGVIILADKMLPPRKHGVLIPGPQAHLMKLGFEKYFLWKMRNGHVNLP